MLYQPQDLPEIDAEGPHIRGHGKDFERQGLDGHVLDGQPAQLVQLPLGLVWGQLARQAKVSNLPISLSDATHSICR